MASNLQPGRDYYEERGCVVFTSYYHLKRGSCCGSGCRHCPYDENGAPRAEFSGVVEELARERGGERGRTGT